MTAAEFVTKVQDWTKANPLLAVALVCTVAGIVIGGLLFN